MSVPTNPSAAAQLVRALQEVSRLDPFALHDARTAAKLCILDTVACGMHGALTEEGEAAFQAVSAVYGPGDATVWGRRARLPAPAAALLNGTAAHARELDDVHPAIIHPGSVVIPAVLSVAEREGSPGPDVLDAVITGYEAMVRIAEAADFLDHRRRGWHGTSTLGPFAAAAAASRLLGLGEQETVWALGLAGTRTGGTWAFAADGAMSKRLHPGAAARDGVLAAYLAKAGFTGPSYVLDADDGGFLPLTASSWDAGRLAAPVSPETLAVLETEYKFFASCKSVHSPAEAALTLRAEGLRSSDVAEIFVEVNDSAMRMAGRAGMPETIAAAQLSIAYGVAVALLHGRADVAVYTPAMLQDAAVRDLVRRIRVQPSDEMNRLRVEQRLSAARLTVRLVDGSERTAAVQRPKSAQRRGIGAGPAVREKFWALCAAAGVPEGRVEVIWELVMGLEELKPAAMNQLYTLLRP